MPTISRMGSSTISLGLGLGGGKSATSSGRSAGGGGVFTNVRSVNFDGTDDFFNTNSTFQSTFQSSFTFSFWCKLDTTSGTQFIFSAQNAANSDRVACFLSSAKVALFATSNGTGTSTIFDNSGTTLTNWFNVVGRFEQSGSNVIKTLFVNGSQKSTQTKAGMTLSQYGTVNSPVNIYAGARNYNNNASFFTNGLMDEIALFGSALSDDDIASVYNSGVPADLSSFSPVAWFRMGDINGGSGTAISNQGSGSVDGQLTNGPTYTTDVPS